MTKLYIIERTIKRKTKSEVIIIFTSYDKEEVDRVFNIWKDGYNVAIKTFEEVKE